MTFHQKLAAKGADLAVAYAVRTFAALLMARCRMALTGLKAGVGPGGVGHIQVLVMMAAAAVVVVFIPVTFMMVFMVMATSAMVFLIIVLMIVMLLPQLRSLLF